MNVLVVGSGGREHALAWCFAKAPSVDQVFVAPGNPGCQGEHGVCNVEINPSDFSALAKLVQTERVDLTVVGPEQPISEGIRDYFDRFDLACFAPTKAAGRLESSKSFAKDFMSRNNIPTAGAFITQDLEEASEFIQQKGAPIVVKADGLAAGKGVTVARTTAEALEAAAGMLTEARFGDAGATVVIEDFMDGEEASFTLLSDGVDVLPLASSQDHKPIFDGDKGPNTGGMGAYSPAPVVSSRVYEKVMHKIVKPTIQGMASEGSPFQGFLYIGLMVVGDEPRVVEYNCRFGDPEAQPVLMRMKSDLALLCSAALEGGLRNHQVDFANECAVGVVLASEGYPNKYDVGFPIAGLDDEMPNAKVFHAGTRNLNGQTVTDGGRVLTVVGLGDDIVDAQKAAYDRASNIKWDGMHMRSDIGHRAVERLNQTG